MNNLFYSQSLAAKIGMKISAPYTSAKGFQVVDVFICGRKVGRVAFITGKWYSSLGGFGCSTAQGAAEYIAKY